MFCSRPDPYLAEVLIGGGFRLAMEIQRVDLPDALSPAIICKSACAFPTRLPFVQTSPDAVVKACNPLASVEL